MNEESKEYQKAKYMALQVGFIETTEEYDLYANALYRAMLWGRTVK